MTDTSGLLASIFPASYRGALSADEAEWIRKKYPFWAYFDIIWVLVVWPAFTILFAIPLRKLYAMLHAPTHPGEGVFICNWYTIALASFMFCAAIVGSSWAHRLVLGRWCNAYLWKYEQKHGYDVEQAARAGSFLFGIIGIIPIIAVFPLVTKVTDNTITNISAFGLGKEQVHIADILKVTRYRTTQMGQKTRNIPVFVFTLKNGTRVNTEGWVADYKEMEGFIKQRHLIVDSAELFLE